MQAPEHMIAVLEALQCEGASTARFRKLTGPDWQRLLAWCDARQLTLMLPHVSTDQMPAAIRQEVANRAERYGLRFARLKQELFDIRDAFRKEDLEFVLLKGFTHSPKFTPYPEMRAQGDIDLWLRHASVYKAQSILSDLGYISLLPAQSRHLSPMARPSNWKWRGDRFDPDMPVSVELHYELWSERMDCIPVPGLDEFWARKTRRVFDTREFYVLRDEDLLGFAALHLLMHILHGELPVQRAWEIANFLHRHANNERFWYSWKEAHAAGLRQLECLVFQLVTTWFRCHQAKVVKTEIGNLPKPVVTWLERFSLSPLSNQFRANKDDLWLHLALLANHRDKIRVFFRRLVPLHLPGYADRVAAKRPGTGLSRRLRQIPLLLSRLARHVWTFLPTMLEGIRWVTMHLSRPKRREWLPSEWRDIDRETSAE
jgi:hypothetical protein